jgi:hypothetical protein
MEHYVGLDVSLKLTAICIVDQTGKIEREGLPHWHFGTRSQRSQSSLPRAAS